MFYLVTDDEFYSNINNGQIAVVIVSSETKGSEKLKNSKGSNALKIPKQNMPPLHRTNHGTHQLFESTLISGPNLPKNKAEKKCKQEVHDGSASLT